YRRLALRRAIDVAAFGGAHDRSVREELSCLRVGQAWSEEDDGAHSPALAITARMRGPGRYPAPPENPSSPGTKALATEIGEPSADKSTYEADGNPLAA